MESLGKLETTLIKNFSFNPRERIVILILFAAILTGTVLNFYSSHSIPENSAVIFDYSHEDSLFILRSTTHLEQTPETEKIIPTVNTITKEELVRLPGVGNALAQRILDFRAQNGPLNNFEALLSVSGIGRKKLEVIQQYIDGLDK